MRFGTPSQRQKREKAWGQGQKCRRRHGLVYVTTPHTSQSDTVHFHDPLSCHVVREGSRAAPDRIVMPSHAQSSLKRCVRKDVCAQGCAYTHTPQLPPDLLGPQKSAQDRPSTTLLPGPKGPPNSPPTSYAHNPAQKMLDGHKNCTCSEDMP
jgi:hypothetical protein